MQSDPPIAHRVYLKGTTLLYMWIFASAGPYHFHVYPPNSSLRLSSPYFCYSGLFSYTSGGLTHEPNDNTCQFSITTWCYQTYSLDGMPSSCNSRDHSSECSLWLINLLYLAIYGCLYGFISETCKIMNFSFFLFVQNLTPPHPLHKNQLSSGSGSGGGGGGGGNGSSSSSSSSIRWSYIAHKCYKTTIFTILFIPCAYYCIHIDSANVICLFD